MCMNEDTTLFDGLRRVAFVCCLYGCRAAIHTDRTSMFFSSLHRIENDEFDQWNCLMFVVKSAHPSFIELAELIVLSWALKSIDLVDGAKDFARPSCIRISISQFQTLQQKFQPLHILSKEFCDKILVVVASVIYVKLLKIEVGGDLSPLSHIQRIVRYGLILIETKRTNVNTRRKNRASRCGKKPMRNANCVWT